MSLSLPRNTVACNCASLTLRLQAISSRRPKVNPFSASKKTALPCISNHCAYYVKLVHLRPVGITRFSAVWQLRPSELNFNIFDSMNGEVKQRKVSPFPPRGFERSWPRIGKNTLYDRILSLWKVKVCARVLKACFSAWNGIFAYLIHSFYMWSLIRRPEEVM